MRQDIKNKILEIFYEYPDKEFTIREVAKLTSVPRATVHKELVKLKKQKLITKDNLAETNLIFKTKKINYYTEEIVKCGLIDKIISELNPSCIILFGSIRKGDSVKDSDIDLFIESPLKKELNVREFERKLKHKIQIFVEHDISKLNEELFNNVVNGIKLFGSFKIK
ncbi:hypothetical protein COU56_00455 [Candidatus Pacearchaeota archaeon CG10_big_fil_rev_8_21_14_0_10_31_9]|nr:MAG: hypothetical protein AUJ62_00025 [Candidatus Pacearchaeota archaeon CG1_02_32_21]PIN96052.1 MAG: hypothetical protein COU56_00455 [Candidatus Pacearchaeota archaeon CG10_big_fil_rev_8_21_14_0_10_31_9]PIZ82804.1 MAG: hypothetical protein COX97_02805 [Candidatus Pacearchaeota archaeon CG_4_10_14_0_2_um_filter_05_32_18]